MGILLLKQLRTGFKWADKKSKQGIINTYRFTEKPNLKIKKFEKMSDE